jgi:hypothetical protein
MPLVKVNDLEMYYEIHGDGTHLVMVNGCARELIELVSELGDYFDPDNHQEDMWRPVLKLK